MHVFNEGYFINFFICNPKHFSLSCFFFFSLCKFKIQAQHFVFIVVSLSLSNILNGELAGPSMEVVETVLKVVADSELLGTVSDTYTEKVCHVKQGFQLC